MAGKGGRRERELLIALATTTCPACASRHNSGIRCSGCLVNHYCSEDCLRRDEALHRQSCHKMAVVGFHMKFDLLQGMTPCTLQLL